MKITARRTHAFVDLKVDEIETTIFGNTHEINEVIKNLQEVIEELDKLKQQEKEDYPCSFENGCDGKVVYNEPTEIFYSERFKQQEQ